MEIITATVAMLYSKAQVKVIGVLLLGVTH